MESYRFGYIDMFELAVTKRPGLLVCAHAMLKPGSQLGSASHWHFKGLVLLIMAAHGWPFGKIDGPGQWNIPHLNQCHLFLTKLTYKGQLCGCCLSAPFRIQVPSALRPCRRRRKQPTSPHRPTSGRPFLSGLRDTPSRAQDGLAQNSLYFSWRAASIIAVCIRCICISKNTRSHACMRDVAFFAQCKKQLCP